MSGRGEIASSSAQADGAPHTAVLPAATPGGLTSAQARDLLQQVGPNDPVSQRSLAAPLQFLATFRNPLVLILLAAAVAAATLGEPVDAAIIIVIVVIAVVCDQLWRLGGNLLFPYRKEED